MKKKIYFEKLFFYYLPLFFYHILKKDEVIVFDFGRELVKKEWLVKIHDLKLFSFRRYVIGKHESMALDAIESIYSIKFKNSSAVKSTCGLYESENIAMGYKKELAKKIRIFYAMQMALKKDDSEINNDEIILYPYDYDFILKLLKETQNFYYEISHIKVSYLMSCLSGMHRCVSRLIHYAAFIFIAGILPWAVLLKRLLIKKSSEIKKYRYVVPITYFDFQFNFKANRTFDFLLDHKEIRKDNTLFLFISTPSQKKIKELEFQGYNTFQCNSIANIFKSDIGKIDINLIIRLLTYWFKNIFFALSEPEFSLVISTKLVFIFTLWNMILSRFRFEHFIIFNDLGITHLGRNILLNRYGCQTWGYIYAGTLGFINANKNLSFYDSRNVEFSFLYYDNYLLWNNVGVHFFKLHPSNKIKNYFNIGCLWSESIRKNADNNAQNYFDRLDIKKKFNKEYKVISFFESTYSYFIPLETGIQLHKDIIKLLTNETRIFVIIKAKKKHSTSDFLCSPSKNEYFALSDELSCHPRCYVAGADKDPSEIVAISDLTVSLAFSSVTIEALGARKRAFFYDPVNFRHGFYYDKVPELIIYGYEGLKKRVNQLLFEVSDDEYNAYLDKYILPEVENYLDGKAITRFQRLLAGEEPDKVLTALENFKSSQTGALNVQFDKKFDSAPI